MAAAKHKAERDGVCFPFTFAGVGDIQSHSRGQSVVSRDDVSQCQGQTGLIRCLAIEMHLQQNIAK